MQHFVKVFSEILGLIYHNHLKYWDRQAMKSDPEGAVSIDPDPEGSV